MNCGSHRDVASPRAGRAEVGELFVLKRCPIV